MIKIYRNEIAKDREISYEIINFSGGELHPKINLDSVYSTNSIVFDARLSTPHSIFELLLLKEAIDNQVKVPKYLECPYLPYARQDRRCEPNEAFSLKVMANLINSMNFDSVRILDCHSDVGPALINRCYNAKVLYPKIGDFIVSPDAGGVKRAYYAAKLLKMPLVKADKIRDTKNGEILRTEVYADSLEGHAYIIDDICDGGRTFIELAKVLKEKGAEKVSLWVTHGIFSKGLRVFEGYIDNIYTTDSRPHSKNFWHAEKDTKVKVEVRNYLEITSGWL